MIISRTPLRISFFGGGTDYREYFERKKGAVIGAAIDKYTYVSLNRLSNYFEYRIRVSYSKSELVNRVDDILHPSVRETLRFKKIDGNLDIHIFTDLPARTGLGSSSSFTVGFLNALYALEGKVVSRQQLAREAIDIEQNMIKENVGCQDQMHAAYGGLNIMTFDRSGVSIRPVVIAPEKFSLLQESMMCFYTGLTRYATEILEEQVSNIKTSSKDAYLDAMFEKVWQAEKVVSDDAPDAMIKDLGALLHESWQLKKCLSSKITNTMIDEAYAAALNAGAYGGKLAGAGGGGFLFFMVEKDRQQKVREALKSLMEVKFRFEPEGSTIIYLK